ncbi:MAG: DNA methyltransferase [Chloroflexia bacterium]|nr:DNA methyltransferase [Chloroflexia bacterium]
MAAVSEARTNGGANKLQVADLPVHGWYRFVLSYPPHLVRHYLDKFGIEAGQRVLDPFCGTGTTLVECKKQGIASVGIEAHPLTHFAASTKVDWSPNPDGLRADAHQLAERVCVSLAEAGVPDDTMPLFGSSNGHHAGPLRGLSTDATKLLLRDSISPRPLHKALTLIDALDLDADSAYVRHERLALAKALVFTSSNLHFGPEVGVGKPKVDAPVVAPFLDNVTVMARDLDLVEHLRDVEAVVHHADSRQLLNVLEPNSVDAVITSPPYPNEKDYTRTTRLESVLLGFVRDKHELRAVKQGLVRSNTRNVYKHDADDAWIANFPEIERIACEIEARRIELGKTSGFERMYARVTKLYFGGMARHLADLRTVLRPGAHLAYVVGDQASYLRVMIRTGQLLAEIGESLGYEVIGIDLFRTRLATATKEQLREEAVILRWPGAKR